MSGEIDEIEAKNIVDMFRQVRKFCSEISRLLETVDDEMAKNGWKTDNVAIADLSKSIKTPEQWIPIMAFRFYTRETAGDKNKLVYVSVLFDDHYNGKYLLEKAVLTAGFFDYGLEEPANWDYRYFRFFGYVSGSSKYLIRPRKIEANGEIFSFNRDDLHVDLFGNCVGKKVFEKGEVFALPLTTIKNPEDLKGKITAKLLARLDASIRH
jgi:hypothetical protein